jgi:hypothetical protein
MNTNTEIEINDTLTLDPEGIDHEFIFLAQMLFSDSDDQEANYEDPFTLSERILNSWEPVCDLYEKARKARKRSSHYKRHLQDCYLLTEILVSRISTLH